MCQKMTGGNHFFNVCGWVWARHILLLLSFHFNLNVFFKSSCQFALCISIYLKLRNLKLTSYLNPYP